MPAPWPDSYFYPAPGYEGDMGYGLWDPFTGVDGSPPNPTNWTINSGTPTIQSNTLEITSVAGSIEKVSFNIAPTYDFNAEVAFQILNNTADSYKMILRAQIDATHYIYVFAGYVSGGLKWGYQYQNGGTTFSSSSVRAWDYGKVRVYRIGTTFTIQRMQNGATTWTTVTSATIGSLFNAVTISLEVNEYNPPLPSVTARFTDFYYNRYLENVVPRRVWGKIFNGPWPDINGAMIDVNVAPTVDRYINTNHNTVTAWSVLNSSGWNLYWDIDGYTWRIRSAVAPSTTYTNATPWFDMTGIATTAAFIQKIKDNLALSSPTPIDPDVGFTWNNFYDRPASILVPGMTQGSSFAQANNTTASFSSPEVQPIYGGGVEAVGQSFTVTGGTVKLWYAWFVIKSTARLGWDYVYDNEPPPAETYYCKLYSHTGAYGSTGVPDTLLATSLPYTANRWSNSALLIPCRFEGAEAINLSAGNYFVVLEYTGGDSTHHLSPCLDTAAPTHGGNFATKTGGVWTADATKDMIFYINSGSGIFFDDGNPPADPNRALDSFANNEHWLPLPYTTKAAGENVTFSSGNTAKWGPSVYWQWGISNTDGMQYVLDYELNMLSGSYPIAIGQTVTGDSTGATATMRAALTQGTADDPGNLPLFGLHDLFTYQNEQIPFDGLEWTLGPDTANSVAVNETSEIDTYIDFKSYRTTGLPEWAVGAVIFDNLSETWMVVLPWDVDRRQYFLYGAPTPSTTKIYYDKVDLLTNYPTWTWYPEIAGAGSVPWVVDAVDPDSTWNDSYFFSWPSIISNGRSVITEVGEDDWGAWFKMRPITITDPYSAIYNQAAKNWNQAEICAAWETPIGRISAGSAERYWLMIVPWGEPTPILKSMGQVIW